MSGLSESPIEDAALAWLESSGWRVAHGPDVAPDAPTEERDDYGEVVLVQRLRGALARLNPCLSADALEDAFRKVSRQERATLEGRNRAFHRMAVDGVTVEYRERDGAVRGAQVRVIDFDDPEDNDWLAVNQYTVVEDKRGRRPDLVLFVNGLPLAIIELKNPGDENATIWSAHRQLQTYMAEIPGLFAFNSALILSDGVEARIRTLTAGREWFKPWRTISGETLATPRLPELQVMLEVVGAPESFLSLIRDFIVFEDDGSGALVKKMAGYHQFHAVQVAVVETLWAAELRQKVEQVAETGRYEAGRKPGGAPGNRRIGVIWHTQGSGKSLTMGLLRVVGPSRAADRGDECTPYHPLVHETRTARPTHRSRSARRRGARAGGSHRGFGARAHRHRGPRRPAPATVPPPRTPPQPQFEFAA